MFQLMNQLEQHGLLRDCFRAGLIPNKLAYFREVALFVDLELKLGVRKQAAVLNASEKFGCTERTVYSALRAMYGELK
jgi:hypothetical protein